MLKQIFKNLILAGFLIFLLASSIYLWFLIGLWSIPYYFLIFIALGIIISYIKDISIPFLGKSLRQSYFDTRFRIQDRQNRYPDNFLSRLKLFIYRVYLKFLKLLILLFKNSTDSFETVREETFNNYSVLVKQVNHQPQKNQVEALINKLRQGHQLDAQTLNQLRANLYKLHQVRQKRVALFSLAGITGIISSTVLVSLVVSLIFPVISQPRASNNMVWQQKSWQAGPTQEPVNLGQGSWQSYSQADPDIQAKKQISLKIEPRPKARNQELKKLLSLESDSINGDQKFIDQSEFAHEIRVNGQVEHLRQTHPTVIGKSSIHFGPKSDFLAVPASDGWRYGAGDFQLDFWFNSEEIQSKHTEQILVSQWQPRAAHFQKLEYWQVFDPGFNKGYEGAAFDGRYLYFVPYRNELNYHGGVLRFDTRQDFHDQEAWQHFDPGFNKGYRGAAFDGRYLYFSPYRNQETYHGDVMRYDTKAPFDQPDSWQHFDPGFNQGYEGAAFDGRYLYFSPYRNADDYHGDVMRYDTKAPFDQPDSWQHFDPGFNQGYRGAVFDGQYIYFVPYHNGLRHGDVLRYNTQEKFDQGSSWQHFDPGFNQGYRGAVFDGQYVYFVPYDNNQRFGQILRLDTTKEFNQKQSWQAFDPGFNQGYSSAVSDQRFVYFVPYNNQQGYFSQVLRFDTTGNNSSFKLGLSNRQLFLTLNLGDRAYSLYSEPKIKAQNWHQVQVRRSKKAIKILLDKQEAVSMPNLKQALNFSDFDLTIGALAQGSSSFEGYLNQLNFKASLKPFSQSDSIKPLSQSLISSPINSGQPQCRIDQLQWQEATPEFTDIKLQLRTAPDINGQPNQWSAWLGPNNQNDYYTDPTGKKNSINALHRDSHNDQWVQYRVILQSQTQESPKLEQISLSFNCDSAPIPIKNKELKPDASQKDSNTQKSRQPNITIKSPSSTPSQSPTVSADQTPTVMND
ncbi:MAG: hypothetical protein GF332_03785 [Candidatus Moranbacteria bacterium]|nr:hypothetical protein [Candidatus Moranbacteria bacterium]